MNPMQAFAETLKVSRTRGHIRIGRAFGSKNVQISKVILE